MRVLLFLCVLLPQLATARVYMCVDQVTGKTSFTDKGCLVTASREEVKIPPANTDSGSRSDSLEPTGNKTWVGDRDTRKTGRDYSAKKNSVADIAPAADSGGDFASGGI